MILRNGSGQRDGSGQRSGYGYDGHEGYGQKGTNYGQERGPSLGSLSGAEKRRRWVDNDKVAKVVIETALISFPGGICRLTPIIARD